MMTHVIIFHPPSWGHVDFFKSFWTTTYAFDWKIQKRLTGIIGHGTKYSTLMRLANRIVPFLEEDEKQLKEHGATPALRAKELAAICETAFCTLYSMLDCCRYVLCAIYPNHRGMRDSTRATFQNGHNEKLDQRVPKAIREAIRSTQPWYGKIRGIRDELTHADVGSCNRDVEKNTVTYMHVGLGTGDKALVIEDVFGELSQYFEKINGFLGRVFLELNKTLVDNETEQICGFFNARVYLRVVRPSEAIDFNGGRCNSYQWFDQEEHPSCPFKDTCGAYAAATNTMMDGKNQ
jgi:hypothetical protein